MPDREKVLIGLEHCSRGVIGCNDCIYRRDFGCRAQLAADALELLKEHEDPDRLKVVRCEDCAYWEPDGTDGEGHCRDEYGPCNGEQTSMTFFCADGEVN